MMCRAPSVQNQHKNQQRHLWWDDCRFFLHLDGLIVRDRFVLILVNSRMNMAPYLNYDILKNTKQQCLNRAQQKVLHKIRWCDLISILLEKRF